MTIWIQLHANCFIENKNCSVITEMPIIYVQENEKWFQSKLISDSIIKAKFVNS